MHGFIAGLRRAEDVTARACLAGCAALVFVAAVSRALGSPIIWAIDIAMLLFIWCAFLGADAALRAKQHIIIDIVVRMFPQRVQRALLIVHWSVMIAFLLALVVLGTQLVQVLCPRLPHIVVHAHCGGLVQADVHGLADESPADEMGN